MFKKIFATLENLLPWSRKLQKAKKLALQAESRVLQLNGLSAGGSEVRDLLDVLQSTCLLLERSLKYSELLSKPKQTYLNEGKPSPSKVALLSKHELNTEPELSMTAKELIKLRDWVLLAKNGNQAPSPEVLSAIYQKIAQILEKEGVTAIEETGRFNYERQRVVSTQVIDKLEKNDWVCATVRPGYLFRGKLIRPQEVIVYTIEQSTALSE